MNGKTEDTGNLTANSSRVVIRQLVDQLKTAFILGLLVFWLSSLKATHGTREEWWVVVILGVAVFVIWLVWLWKKGRRAPKWWQPLRMLIVIEGVVGFWYWISGVPNNVTFLFVIGCVLLLWAVLLLLALVLVMVKRVTRGGLGNAISKFAEQGESANGVLSVALLASSIVLGWSRLWSAGHRGLWMTALLYIGIAVLFIVASAPLFSRAEGNS